MVSGFAFSLYGRDYFVPSNLVIKTKTIAKKIIAKFPKTEEIKTEWIFENMQKCDMEKTSTGYYICGNRYGNHFTLCIPIGEREDFVIMEV